MKARNNISRYFIMLKFLADCLLIPLIVVTAYGLKFKIGWLLQYLFSIGASTYPHAQLEPYLRGSWLIIVLWISTFYYSGLYTTFRGIMP